MLALRGMRFAEENEGIPIFAKSIFKAGQVIPYGLRIDWKSCLLRKSGINLL